MTREEAKNWIEDLISEMKEETSGNYPDPEYRDEVYEALEMAINALSAIEDIKQEIEKAMGEYYYSEHDLGVRQGFRFALEIIDKYRKEQEWTDKTKH